MKIDDLQRMFDARRQVICDLDALRHILTAETAIVAIGNAEIGGREYACTVPSADILALLDGKLLRLEAQIGAAIGAEVAAKVVADLPSLPAADIAEDGAGADAETAQDAGQYGRGFWAAHRLHLAALLVAGKSYAEISATEPFFGRSEKSLNVAASKMGLTRDGAARAIAEAQAAGFAVPDITDPTASPNVHPAERRCLRCGKSFMSNGPHNRLCGPCRTAAAGVPDGM